MTVLKEYRLRDRFVSSLYTATKEERAEILLRGKAERVRAIEESRIQRTELLQQVEEGQAKMRGRSRMRGWRERGRRSWNFGRGRGRKSS